MYKIAVAGMGYVGLSNALLLSVKHDVIGLDTSSERVDKINNGIAPIGDDDIMLALASSNCTLKATLDYQRAFSKADFVIISTPTDYDSYKNCFDTSSVESVIEKVMSCNDEATIVVKSTVPVGFTDSMAARFQTDRIIFSPEFLREGSALFDNLNPSRIIVGGGLLESSQVFANLLKDAATKKDVRVLLTGAAEAEAIKLFANSYLAMRVAFFNELDSYAMSSGLDSREIINGVGLDPRIGDHYNNPSFGYGGYCLPKDTKQLLAGYSQVPQNLIRAIVDANRTRKDFIAQQIITKKPNIVGIYRLVMKVGSDNFRQSSVQGIMRRLKESGIKLMVYEPQLEGNTYLGSSIERDLSLFKEKSDVIIANRITDDIRDVESKLFSRDLFGVG